MTIYEKQAQIASALQQLPVFASQLPDSLKPLIHLAPSEGTKVNVSLRHARNNRKVRIDASEENWSPESGTVSISYQPSPSVEMELTETKTAEPAPSSQVTHSDLTRDPAQELLLELAKAEQDPQLSFVSLKWFRDTFLPQQGHDWTAATSDRQRVLVEAIQRQWVVTTKVPNPKNPQFPVTAVRVNRTLPEVRGILDSAFGFRPAYTPVTIPGERLSETVLGQRR